MRYRRREHHPDADHAALIDFLLDQLTDDAIELVGSGDVICRHRHNEDRSAATASWSGGELAPDAVQTKARGERDERLRTSAPARP